MALQLKASEALKKLWLLAILLAAIVALSSTNSLAEEASTASSEDGISVQSHTCSSGFFFNWETQYIASSLNEKDSKWYKINVDQDGELGVKLDGPNTAADFDLYVYESCSSSWVCRPYEDDADEYCKMDARKGDYYIKVNAYSGKGNFDLYADLFKQDLIVSDIWATPASVDEKTIFDLHWSVKNLGKDEVVDDFENELYVNGKLEKPCSITKDMVSGEAVECHWLDQQFVPGTYTLKAVADTDDDVFETNEDNNERTETLEVKSAPKYDLAPAYVLVDPYDPTDKDKVILRYPITNVGPDDIKGKVALKSFLDDNSTICTTNDGVVARDKFICKREITLKAGWYKLKTIADPDNEIPETDEGNNEQTQDLLVSHKTDYDLTVTEIWTSPGGELNDKMTFGLNWYVKNIGSDDIKDEFESEVMVDDLLKHTCIIKELKAGNSQSCTLENQKWKAGKHNVVAFADSGGDIGETDDNKDSNNNKLVKNFDVIHIPEADIVVTDIYTDPASPTEKDTFTVKFDLKNVGSEAVPSGFKSNVFINGEPKGTWCYTINLGAGTTQTCTFGKQKWQPGSYAVKVFADAENAINELTETNNELEKQIEVLQYCKIKDGSAADCECNKDTDCLSGYYCSLKEGYDSCKPLACKNECSQAGGYLCSQGDVYECGNYDSDLCLETKRKQVCDLYRQKCNPAKGSCDNPPSSVKLQLEDALIHETIVYKQPGDLVEVTITSDKLQDVEFSHPENFTLTYGICNSKTAAAPGETKCVFQISETTANDEYYFTANEKTAAVAVTDKPKAIIITNKQKLSERFQNDKAGVKALLEQAFQYASNEENTVVYYMDREIEGHPFRTFNDYKETFAEPKLTDNTYAAEVAGFVKSRCSECSILLLGDDFVVPFHRHDVANEKGALWWKDLETSNIYTDLPYNSLTLPTFSKLDYDRFFQSGPVTVVLPSYMGKDDQELLELKKALVDTYHSFKLEQNKECAPIYFGARTVTFPHYCKGECFNPNGCDVGNKNLTSTELVTVLKSEEVGCNSFGKLEGKTLIIIGDKENNHAMACFPWVQSSEYPLISLQRNVWDGSKGAVLLNLPQEHKSLGMYVLAEVVARGEVYTYIPMGSDFEIIPFLKELAPLSTCDDAVSVEKSGIYVVERGSMLFCLLDIPTFGKASVIGIVGKGGKVFKAATAPAKVAKEYKRLYELGKKAGKEFEITKALGKAPTSLPYISLRYEKYGKAGARLAFDKFMAESVPEAASMTEKDFGHFVKGLNTLTGVPPVADISKWPVKNVADFGTNYEKAKLLYGQGVADDTLRIIKKLDALDAANEYPKVFAGVGYLNELRKGVKDLIEIHVDDLYFLKKEERDAIILLFKEGYFKKSLTKKAELLKMPSLTGTGNRKLVMRIEQFPNVDGVPIDAGPAFYLPRRSLLFIKPIPDEGIRRSYALTHPDKIIRGKANEIMKLSNEEFIQQYGPDEFFKLHSKQIDSIIYTESTHELIHYKIHLLRTTATEAELLGIIDAEIAKRINNLLYFFEEGANNYYALKVLKGADLDAYKEGFEILSTNDHAFLFLKDGTKNIEGTEYVRKRLKSFLSPNSDYGTINYITFNRAFAKQAGYEEHILEEYDKLIEEVFDNNNLGHVPWKEIKKSTEFFEMEYENMRKILDKTSFVAEDTEAYKEILVRVRAHAESSTLEGDVKNV